MPSGTSSPFYPEQPEPPAAVEPNDSYFLVRLHDAQAYFDAGLFARSGTLTACSSVESTFQPKMTTQSLHQIVALQKNTPCRLGMSANLTDWLPAYPSESLRITLKYSLLQRSAFQDLASLFSTVRLAAKLTLQEPEWAVALKVSEIVERLMAKTGDGERHHELFSLVLDLNVANLKAGYYAVLGSRGERIWPRSLRVDADRRLVADGNMLSRLCYAVLEVLALRRRGPHIARSAPWWELLQVGKNRALETASGIGPQRDKARAEWYSTLTLVRLLARNERCCLPNEIRALIHESHHELEEVLAPQTTSEGHAEDQLPVQWRQLLELNTDRELRSSVQHYHDAIEQSRRLLDQYNVTET